MRVVALDVETSMAPAHFPWAGGSYLSCVGLIGDDGYQKTFWFNHSSYDTLSTHQDQVNEIQSVIDSYDAAVAHNLKFDIIWMQHVGVCFDNVKLHCTMVADYLINAQRKIGYSLDVCLKRRGLPLKEDKVKEFWNSGIDTFDIPADILQSYLLQDCRCALQLYHEQVKDLKRCRLTKVAALQFEMSRVLAEIESNGMLFDTEAASFYAQKYSIELEKIDDRLRTLLQLSDLNVGSPKQLSAALFGGTLITDSTEWVIKECKHWSRYYERKCKVPVKYGGILKPARDQKPSNDGLYSVDRTHLSQLRGKTRLQKEVLGLLARRSEISIQIKTFFVGLSKHVSPVDGCIHPSYNQTITTTGRLSSSRPNGQNIPRKKTSKVKRVFIPRYDKIVNVDLSQLEWRVCAFLCQDPVMLAEINRGADAHTDNAIKFFGSQEYRDNAKIFVFRMIYGGSAYGFYKDPNMPRLPLQRWEQIVDNFYAKYRGIREWHNRQIEKTYKHNGLLINPTGRRFQLEPQFVNERQGKFSIQKIKNYPVQSLATADIMPLAMHSIYHRVKRGGYRSLFIGQVHDSLLFDSPDDEVQAISNLCIGVFNNLPTLIKKYWGFEFNVPLTGDAAAGINYSALKEVVIS